MELEHKAVKFQIKWGRKKLDYEMEQGEDYDTFKAKLYSMTMVPPDKMKIVFKGKVLKDDASFLKAKFQEKQKVALIGKAEHEQMNLESIEKKIFIEDLTKEQRAKYLKEKYGEVMAYGLVNLGNTCYINSTMQVFRKIPELKEAICREPSGGDPGSQGLMRTMGQVFQDLETQGDTVEPRMFIQTFMSIFPQFAERTQYGTFQQQDADECFQAVLQRLSPSLPSSKQSLINDLFSFDIKYKMSQAECPEEPETISFESLSKLPCMIDSGSIEEPINSLQQGIKFGLSSQLEKHQEILGRNALFEKVGELSSLPKYLIVHKMRFVWKQADRGTRTDARKAKILRRVLFPMTLDLEPFACEELKQKLEPARQLKADRIEKQLESNKKKFEEFQANRMEDENMDTLKINKEFKALEKQNEVKQFDQELYREFNGNNQTMDTGEYGLVGVITHKGRQADSGHYVGWCHHSGDVWFKYDDDKVTKIQSKDVLALAGGGDWHTAYYLVYRKLQEERPKEGIIEE